MFVENSQNTMSIHCFNQEGSEIHNFGNFKADQTIFVKRGDRLSPIYTSASPTTVWITTKSGNLYAGFSDKYLINKYQPDGKIAFKFGRNYTPIPDKHEWLHGQMDHLPAFSRNWLLDENENLWIELFNPNDRNTIVYDIFSSSGIYLNQVHLKHRISCFKNERAFCIVYTEDRVPLIKRFKLVESERSDY